MCDVYDVCVTVLCGVCEPCVSHVWCKCDSIAMCVWHVTCVMYVFLYCVTCICLNPPPIDNMWLEMCRLWWKTWYLRAASAMQNSEGLWYVWHRCVTVSGWRWRGCDQEYLQEAYRDLDSAEQAISLSNAAADTHAPITSGHPEIPLQPVLNIEKQLIGSIHQRCLTVLPVDQVCGSWSTCNITVHN